MEKEQEEVHPDLDGHRIMKEIFGCEEVDEETEDRRSSFFGGEVSHR